VSIRRRSVLNTTTINIVVRLIDLVCLLILIELVLYWDIMRCMLLLFYWRRINSSNSSSLLSVQVPD
jgi:hypothetical protein